MAKRAYSKKISVSLYDDESTIIREEAKKRQEKISSLIRGLYLAGRKDFTVEENVLTLLSNLFLQYIRISTNIRQMEEVSKLTSETINQKYQNTIKILNNCLRLITALDNLIRSQEEFQPSKREVVKIFSVRVTDEEFEIIQEDALKYQLTRAALIRSICLREIKGGDVTKEKLQNELNTLTEEIRQVGIRINTLAASANSKKVLSEEEVKQAEKHMQEVETLLAQQLEVTQKQTGRKNGHHKIKKN